MPTHTSSTQCACCNTCPEYPSCDGDAIYLGEDENGCPIYECCPGYPYCEEGQEVTEIDYDSNGCVIYQCCQSPPACADGRLVQIDQESNGCPVYQCCPEIPACPTAYEAKQSGIDSNQCPTYSCQCYNFGVSFDVVPADVRGRFGDCWYSQSYERYSTFNFSFNSSITENDTEGNCTETKISTVNGSATFTCEKITEIIPNSFGSISNRAVVTYVLQNPSPQPSSGEWIKTAIPVNRNLSISYSGTSCGNATGSSTSWSEYKTPSNRYGQGSFYDSNAYFNDAPPSNLIDVTSVVTRTDTSKTTNLSLTDDGGDSSYQASGTGIEQLSLANKVDLTDIAGDAISVFKGGKVSNNSQFNDTYETIGAGSVSLYIVCHTNSGIAISGARKFRFKFSSSPTGYLKVWFEKRTIVRDGTDEEWHLTPYSGTVVSDTSEIISHEFSTSTPSDPNDCNHVNYALDGDFVSDSELQLDLTKSMSREILFGIKKYSFIQGYEPQPSQWINTNGFPPPSWWGATPP